MSVQEEVQATPVQTNEENHVQPSFVKYSPDPETTVFVGNVDSNATSAELKAVFGNEVEVEIPVINKRDGRMIQTRHAFVKFPSTINPQEIKEKFDGEMILDKPIFIKKALTNEQLSNQRSRFSFRGGSHRGYFRGGYSRGGSQRGGYFRGNSRGGNVFRGNGRYNNPRKERVPLEEMERSTDTVYVNNVAYSATKEEIAEFFGTTPELVVLPMKRIRDYRTRKFFFSKTVNRGIAFVTFENLTGDIKSKVDEFNGKSFKDRELSLDVAAKKPVFDEEEKEHAEFDESKPVEEENKE